MISELRSKCFQCKKSDFIDKLLRQRFPTIVNGKEMFGAFHYWYFCSPSRKIMPEELKEKVKKENLADKSKEETELINSEVDTWLGDINNSPCWIEYKNKK